MVSFHLFELMFTWIQPESLVWRGGGGGGAPSEEVEVNTERNAGESGRMLMKFLAPNPLTL